MTTDELVDEERQWTDAVREKPAAQPPLYQQLICEPIEKTNPPPALCVTPETTVRDALNLMKQHGHGCVLVEEHGRLVGIFTERDVLFRVIGGGREPAVIPVAEVMTPDPEALTMKDELAYVLNLMAVGGFRHVPIVDGEHRPVAVFSVRHVVERLVEFFPNEVLNLPPRPGKNVAHAREGA